MQGKKDHQEKLFIQFQLSDYVPADNFYRRLKKLLNLDFLYRSTSAYYGKEGQKSIDPVVFMKLMLVGYLENINSDRRIIAASGMRMDILYFLGYDLGEELPWHSTLSRTRKLYGEETFLDLFKQVLKLCINHGLINGTRQAVDSALIPANAAKQSMVERLVMEDASVFSRELNDNSEDEPKTPEDDNKGGQGNPDKKNKKSAQVNETHYSPSDPDARLTTKPGKPMRLYYRAQMSVDTASHYITYIQAFKGNQADNTSLPLMLPQIAGNMADQAIQVEEILADTGYSSGKAIRALTANGMKGFIPNPGNYKSSREIEGFTYEADHDRYTCIMGVHLPFRRIESAYKEPTVLKKIYESNISDCKNCPCREICANKKGFKKLIDSADKPLYEYMQRRVESPKGKLMKLLRSSTVEPVFGSLINHTGLNRINSKGLKQANKCMLMAATAYNLKKLLKYKFKPIQETQKQISNFLNSIFDTLLSSFKQQYAINASSWF
ncbi:IS1182 family transposase [Mucilaginibacter gotjawali]|uniref:Transposase DDE domain protein n=2 Tax=Mucilaginibacter gotjawali TaxID=1550579 RepID=A0A125T1Z6_9SPHI|nr:IS1182 family transposase [Mucilaginibacter gotjawali]MBB3059190.1 transposase [Mucilaginibacter gotjawali]BAU52128.1 Transposase DDE domain protein [Mucilaginibacter gotjawali]BAU55777.1 Transposase DDE domain protein [Mucilaginibacter gotjawali]